MNMSKVFNGQSRSNAGRHSNQQKRRNSNKGGPNSKKPRNYDNAKGSKSQSETKSQESKNNAKQSNWQEVAEINAYLKEANEKLPQNLAEGVQRMAMLLRETYEASGEKTILETASEQKTLGTQSSSSSQLSAKTNSLISVTTDLRLTPIPERKWYLDKVKPEWLSIDLGTMSGRRWLDDELKKEVITLENKICDDIHSRVLDARLALTTKHVGMLVALYAPTMQAIKDSISAPKPIFKPTFTFRDPLEAVDSSYSSPSMSVPPADPNPPPVRDNAADLALFTSLVNKIRSANVALMAKRVEKHQKECSGRIPNLAASNSSAKDKSLTSPYFGGPK
jgi:hypothetical protein